MTKLDKDQHLFMADLVAEIVYAIGRWFAKPFTRLKHR
jgi:hypothetical protein